MHPKLQLYSDAGEFVFFLIFILMSFCQIDWIVHNRFLNLLKLTYFIFWQWKPRVASYRRTNRVWQHRIERGESGLAGNVGPKSLEFRT